MDLVLVYLDFTGESRIETSVRILKFIFAMQNVYATRAARAILMNERDHRNSSFRSLLDLCSIIELELGDGGDWPCLLVPAIYN